MSELSEEWTVNGSTGASCVHCTLYYTVQYSTIWLLVRVHDVLYISLCVFYI